MMTEQDSVRAAFARAADRLALVHRIGRTSGGYEVFSVGSSQDADHAYRVTVGPGGVYWCGCPSGERVACVHRAAVAIRRANDRAAAEHHARAAGLLVEQRTAREQSFVRSQPITSPFKPERAAPRRLPPREEDAWLDRAGV